MWGINPALLQRRQHDDAGVWPENAAAVRAFLCVQTQWRQQLDWDGKIKLFGLDYAGVKAGFEGAGIAATPVIWAGLRIIEASVKEEVNGR